MDIVLKPKSVARFFALIVIGLGLAHVARYLLLFYFGRSFGLFLFDLDREQTIPNLYSSVALLFCSVLLTIIAFAKKSGSKAAFLQWLGLSGIFLFLSIDESVSIHEQFIQPLRTALHTSGFLYFPWLIPYSIFVIVVFLVYLKFLISLPTKTRLLFLIAASIYLTGAMGLELLGGYQADTYGQKNITYIVLISIEEILEMTGIVVFIYAITSYISSMLPNLRLRVSSEKDNGLLS